MVVKLLGEHGGVGPKTDLVIAATAREMASAVPQAPAPRTAIRLMLRPFWSRSGFPCGEQPANIGVVLEDDDEWDQKETCDDHRRAQRNEVKGKERQ